MFMFKKHVPRRTVPRGLGAARALPWLDSMVPALTALAQSCGTPNRTSGRALIPTGNGRVKVNGDGR